VRGYQGLTFKIQADNSHQDVLVGLRDSSGSEPKVSLSEYDSDGAAEGWQLVTIPFTAFGDDLDWSRINAVTLSFEHRFGASGMLVIDDLAIERHIGSFLVDDFEKQASTNLLSQQHLVYMEGAAAINGRYTHNSPNGIFSISYGGNIGAINVYASGLKSFAGWMTKLGGVNCTECQTLAFDVRGAEGDENFTVYLSDGNFEWGWPVSGFEDITTEWKTVRIPLDKYSEYGVDLTHLDSMKLVFEGVRMSGTVFIDNVRLEGGSVH
jgi:hypothetical protein